VTGAGFDGVDLDLLADYVGGALIGTPDDERVAGLIADDPVWREAYQRLAPGMATVGAMLRDLPAEPMPGDLAGRLDALFATPAPTPLPAQVTAADAVGESADPVPAKVLDLADAKRARAAGGRPRRALRWAAPISIAAGVVAFAGFGLSQLGGGASDSGASQSAADAEAPMVAMAPQVGDVLQTGTDYDVAALGQPLAASGSRVYSGAPQFESEEARPEVSDQAAGKSALSRLSAPDALAACLDAIAAENGGGPLTVEWVDYARFTGAPALIVRFSAANGGWGWAVGADCGAPGSDADTLQRVPVR
jgi:hypothetical protein